jgi:hypothetical protein
MIVYAMALPERYDVACGAYAFALVVTLAATGGYTTGMLLSRAWETVLGVSSACWQRTCSGRSGRAPAGHEQGVRLCSENSELFGKTPPVRRRESSDRPQGRSRSRLAEKSGGSAARHHLRYNSTGRRG